MANFAKYMQLKNAVDALPDGEDKEHIKWKCGQLLHMIQGKEVAKGAWRKYIAEMRSWENNIVESIECEIKKIEN